MRFSIRPLVAAMLLGSYAAVSLCAPGLHLLLGCGHAELARSADHSRDGTSQDRPLSDFAGCAICQFQSQGQLPAELASHPVCDQVCPLVPPGTPIVVAQPVPSPYDSRGPPSPAPIG